MVKKIVTKTGAKKTTQKAKVRKINPLKPKSAQVCDQYLDMKAGRLKPITYAWLDRFCSRLTDWATNDETALHIGSFYTKEEVSKKDFYRLAEKHKELKDALAFALEAIERRALEKNK